MSDRVADALERIADALEIIAGDMTGDGVAVKSSPAEEQEGDDAVRCGACGSPDPSGDRDDDDPGFFPGDHPF